MSWVWFIDYLWDWRSGNPRPERNFAPGSRPVPLPPSLLPSPPPEVGADGQVVTSPATRCCAAPAGELPVGSWFLLTRKWDTWGPCCHQKVDRRDSGHRACQRKLVLLECRGLCLVSSCFYVCPVNTWAYASRTSRMFSSWTMTILHSSRHWWWLLAHSWWLMLRIGCHTWEGEIQGPKGAKSPAQQSKLAPDMK